MDLKRATKVDRHNAARYTGDYVKNGNGMSAKGFTRAELVRIADHGGESWLERQIKDDPRLIGLEAIQVVSTQIRHRAAGRLDILARDVEGTVYVVEIMLGHLDADHVTRSLDYWLREKSRMAQKKEPIAVIAAENIRGSRFYEVVKFLSKALPLIVIEMQAHKVGRELTLIPVALIDSTASTDAESVEIEQQDDMDEEAWQKKSSIASVEAISKCKTILKKVASGISLNWGNRNFIGITVRNKPRNFLVFKPKQKWVRVHARYLQDSEKWRKKLAKAGLQIVGGKPGRSIHFRLSKSDINVNSQLLQALFRECYSRRMGEQA
jgi:hypothetical protein